MKIQDLKKNTKNNSLKIQQVTLGEGSPKICVSLMGKDKEEIEIEARRILNEECDMVEWRVDWFQMVDCNDPETNENEIELDLVKKNINEILDILAMLRNLLGEMPIIFTIRTMNEGGQASYSQEAYKWLNIEVAKSGFVDIIDVELFIGSEIATEIIKETHKALKYVIASSHDFQRTPCEEELISRMLKMDALHADILKVAVMPKSSKDVLSLLEVTRKMSEELTTKPIVTMSMSELGIISRVSGEVFGSAITFGASGQVSAPGQLPVSTLREGLQIFHTN